MARPEGGSRRNEWYAQKLEEASTPKRKIHILQGRLAADIKRLPEEWQDEAFEMTAHMLQNIIDELQIRCAEERWPT